VPDSRDVFAARKERALADISELEAQVASGEISARDAAVLRRRYEAEAVDAMAALDSIDDEEDRRRSPMRPLLAVAAFAVILGGSFVALVRAVEPRPPGGFITGGVAADAARDGGVDLSRVTNEELEAVVAANPDVVPMRLALARRYVEDGQFSAALPHYMAVLERQDHPEALMYLGWMTYASGDAATGASLLERSLELAPDNILAMWFLANARLYGLDRPDDAIPLLEAVIASGEAPADIVDLAVGMLAEARGSAP
jgi:tetratricopeptide (TPR) repeat protein